MAQTSPVIMFTQKMEFCISPLDYTTDNEKFPSLGQNAIMFRAHLAEPSAFAIWYIKV